MHSPACAIIPAAGKGDRLQAAEPKQFLELKDRPMLAWSAAAVAAARGVEMVVVGVMERDVERTGRILEKWITKPFKVVQGGSTRQETVRRCLLEAGREFDLVVVHDAARPFVTRELAQKVMQAAEEKSAAAPAVQPGDTVKLADGRTTGYLDREKIMLLQTPQAFEAGLIKEAHERAAGEGFLATDDTALVERTGKQVALVQGEESNIKITTPFQWRLALAMAGAGMVAPPD